MPGPAPKHILQAMDRIGRAIEDRERTRLIAVGAEVERQSDAQAFIGRVMMAFLWDTVALAAACGAVRAYDCCDPDEQNAYERSGPEWTAFAQRLLEVP